MNSFSKKLLYVMLLMLVVFSVVSGAEEKSSSEDFTKARSMIKSNLFLEKEGVGKMQAISTNLSTEERNKLYRENQKDSILFLALDIMWPSVGSWIAGDYTGAIVALAGISGGFLLVYRACTVRLKVEEVQTYVTIGLGMMIGAYIYSCVSVFVFSENYNSKLKEGLLIANLQEERYNNFLALSSPMVDTSFLSQSLFHLNLVSLSF